MNIRTNAPVKPPEFPPISLVLYGQAKVGKTTESAKALKPLFFNLEDGLKNIAADIVDIDTIPALAAALDEFSRDLRAGRLAYRSAILDGFTSFVTKESLRVGGKDPRKIAKTLAEGLLPALETFFALPCTRIITLHSRTTLTEAKVDGRNVTIIAEEPDVSPRLRTFIVGKADAIGFCHTVNNASRVEWLPTDTATLRIVAGNRLGLPRTTDLSFAVWNSHLTAPAKPAPAPASAVAAPTGQGAPAVTSSAPAPTNGAHRGATLRCRQSLLAPQLATLGIIHKQYLGVSGQANFLADAGARGFTEVTEANLKEVAVALASAGPASRQPAAVEDF